MAEQKDEDDHKHWYDSKLEQHESKDDIPKANAEAARLTLVHPGGEESPY